MKLLWNFFWREMELKRQVLHLGFGLAYALGFYLGYVTPLISLGMFVGSILLSMFLKKRRRFIDRLILMFERENHLFDIPLRGFVFFMLGVTIAITFFEPTPALAGIIVLSVADSIGTLYGKYMGRVKIPWNKDKHLEGPVIGGAIAAGICSAFLPIWVAMVAGFSGAFLDTLNLRIGRFEVDDNLTIPVFCALIVVLLI